MREALFVFAITRAAVFIIFVLVGHLSLASPIMGDGTEETGRISAEASSISLQNAAVTRALRHTISQGDVNLYVNLSRRGYERQPFGLDPDRASQFAFFPLHPLLLWLLGKLFSDVVLVGALLSNVFFFAALVVLHKLVAALGCDGAAANRAVFYAGIFPASYFFSLPSTEALFLLLTVTSFYAAARGRWLASGVLGALASATRANGIILLPALCALYFTRRRNFTRRQLGGLFLVPAGLLAYMFYSWSLSGNAFAFIDAQRMWGRRFGFFLRPLFDYLIQPYFIASPWNFNLLNFAAAALAFACVWLLLKQRQSALACYLLLSILLPLSSLTLQSFTRYASTFFPIFIALAVAGRSRYVDQIVSFIFIVLFALMTALFAARYSMALT